MSWQRDYDALSATLTEKIASLSTYQIPHQSIRFSPETELVVGGFGDIRRATYDKPGGGPMVVAVKTLRPAGNQNQRLRVAVALAREVKVWSGLEHPNIVRLLGFHLDMQDDVKGDANRDVMWLVSRWEPFGNIVDYLSRNEVDELTKLQLALDTAEGLAFLHTRNPGVCHGDIKGANVLVSQEKRAMWCDFGLAKALDDIPTGLTTSDRGGTTRYTSPELLNELTKKTLKTDVWAWACVFIEVVSSRIPYSTAKTEPHVILAIVQGRLPVPIEDPSIPDYAREMVTQCWSPQAAFRPTMTACVDVLSRHLQNVFRDQASYLLEANNRRVPEAENLEQAATQDHNESEMLQTADQASAVELRSRGNLESLDLSTLVPPPTSSTSGVQQPDSNTETPRGRFSDHHAGLSQQQNRDYASLLGAPPRLGNKRPHDVSDSGGGAAVDSFFRNMKQRKYTATYDAQMAERLSQLSSMAFAGHRMAPNQSLGSNAMSSSDTSAGSSYGARDTLPPNINPALSSLTPYQAANVTALARSSLPSQALPGSVEEMVIVDQFLARLGDEIAAGNVPRQPNAMTSSLNHLPAHVANTPIQVQSYFDAGTLAALGIEKVPSLRNPYSSRSMFGAGSWKPADLYSHGSNDSTATGRSIPNPSISPEPTHAHADGAAQNVSLLPRDSEYPSSKSPGAPSHASLPAASEPSSAGLFSSVRTTKEPQP